MSTDVIDDIEWFRENRAGEPIVLTLYHGTTHEFSEFAPDRLNSENMFGRQYYFTTSEDDAERNYASETGPDLNNRIEHAAELAWNAEEYETLEESIHEHRKMFHGGREAVLTVELSLRNPLILGRGVKHGLIPSWDDANDQAVAALADEMGCAPEDIAEDEELYERAIEASNLALTAAQDELSDKVWQALDRLNMHPGRDDAVELLVSLLSEEESVDEVLRIIKEKEPYIYLFEDENYTPSCAPVLCELLHMNGHDAIILLNADEQCRNMEIEPGTAHVALGVDHADQIRIIERRELSSSPDYGM